MSNIDYIPRDDQELNTMLENLRVKLLEHLETLKLIQLLGGSIAGGGTTINLAQGPFSPDIRLRAKNDSVNMVDISIGLAATPTTFIEPAITGGKQVQRGEEKTFLLSELGTGNFLNMTNPYPDAGSLQVSIASPDALEINGKIIELEREITLTLQAKTDWMQQAQKKNNKKTEVITHLLRNFIKHQVKASKGYTTDIGKDMGVIKELIHIDPNTLKPILKVRLEAGKPELIWKKEQTDGIDFYADRATGTFVYAGHDVEPNWTDTFALPTAPQLWRYRAIHVLHDLQVGQFSEIVEIMVKKPV